MPERVYWIGTQGPYYYDDADEQVTVDEANEDNDPDPTLVTAFRTEGQLRVGTAPTEPTHVLRKDEFDSFALQVAVGTSIENPDLSSYGPPTTFLIVSGEKAGQPAVTLYVYSTVPASPIPPFICTSSSTGFWIAVAGMYNANA